MKRIAVIGAGPAGLIAAAFAKTPDTEVILFDRNEKVGKKLYLTGKGRCNITNAAEKDEFMRNIPRNPRFLYSAFGGFFNNDIIDLIESNGVPTKVERGGRVFPESDKSSDVIKALNNNAKNKGVVIRLDTRVKAVEKDENGFTVSFFGKPGERFDAVIVATGGLSYPSTGSTGDGYSFAEAFGHTVAKRVPSLVSLATEETWAGELAGLSLKNVTLTAFKGKNKVYSELGEMLFTHTGVSGPLVLSASARIADEPEGARLFIDMKPALDEQTLEARILRDLEQNKHKQMKNAILGLLPSRMVPIALDLAGIDPEKTTDTFTKAERRRLTATLKAIPLTVKKASSMEEAIITRGGVSIREIDPKTMGSKLVPGLYFAGEVLDVDAYTGGFNLQIAYSTGAAAGRAAADITNDEWR
ncbi:MAG: NAD(P)/FAD-dependent oxidoreductase [Clostridiales bacterium]|nr:NAD(P)/FAD-dependent oxidoreductase [Clostridiales bacterium]